MTDCIQGIVNSHIRASRELLEYTNHIEIAARTVIDTIKRGNKILICGNGGSAADAQHFAAELVGRFKRDRKAIPAIALTTDTSVLTALSNDYTYDIVFTRQINALANKDDLVIGISTSGNSQNIYNAISSANLQKCGTLCLLGGNGGKVKDICDFSIVVPSLDTARVQEMHILIIHILCELIDKNLR